MREIKVPTFLRQKIVRNDGELTIYIDSAKEREKGLKKEAEKCMELRLTGSPSAFTLYFGITMNWALLPLNGNSRV